MRLGDKYIDISSEEDQRDRSIVAVSDFPVEDAATLQPLHLPANRTKQVWVTISASPGATPGRHLWEVTASSPDNKVRMVVPVVVNILPFALADPKLEYSIYYRGYLDPIGRGSISSERKSQAQLAAELANQADHGISNPTVYQPPDSVRLFEDVLHQRAKAGLSKKCVYYLGITTGNYGDTGSIQARLVQYNRLQRAAGAEGIPCVDVYGVDEAEARDIVGQFPVWERFRQAGAGIFTAAWRDGSAERQYAGRLKILTLGIEPDPSVNGFYRAAGTAVYLYNQPQVGVENPLIYRINYGLAAWRQGFDGVMNYAYQDSMGVIWNDFDHPEFRDHVFAYPTTSGVVDTIAWEGFREAVDDVRYVSTLQSLAEVTKSPEAVKAVARVRDMGGFDPARARDFIVQHLRRLCEQFKTDPRVANICLA